MASYNWPPKGGGSVTSGNLTDVGTDGIVITNGTNAVLGSGTQIAQHVADSTHNGYLSSTDWSTFNSKQAALTIGNLTDAGTDGITITSGTGAVIGSGTSISQHVADATHNGYLSSADWVTFNAKQAALTIGNFTDVGTDGIVVTGGTGSIIGSGVSIAQHVADSTHNGYLLNTDWVAFNAKQAAGNYITALTGDGTASGPGSAAFTLASVATAGTTGSSTSIPAITINVKGLVTSITGNAVIAPAGTLTGTTLASNVVTSSLTSVGTIATGVWNGTAVDVAHGGTGDTSLTAYAVLCGGTTSTGVVQSIASVGSSGNVLTSNGAGALPTFQAASTGTTLRGYIAGLITSYSSTTVLGVATGIATDSTGATYLSLASAFTKSTAGTFVAGTGNNGLDAGSIGNNQTWHVHLVSKAAGASPDVLFSLSPTAPTLPSTYTLFRRIGSFLTNGSAQIIQYTQINDEFRLLVVVQDVNAANPGTSAVTRTLASVPTGVVVTANIIPVLVFGTTSVNGYVSFSALVDTDESAGNAGNAGFQALAGGGTTYFGYLGVPTNTSAQIRTRNAQSDSGTSMIIRTRGWTDSRGVNL